MTRMVLLASACVLALPVVGAANPPVRVAEGSGVVRESAGAVPPVIALEARPREERPGGGKGGGRGGYGGNGGGHRRW